MPWAPITRPLPEQLVRSLVSLVLCVSTCPQVTAADTGAGDTVQVNVAGEASTFDDSSMARTEKLCPPTDRPVRSTGEVHGAKAPASSLHSKVLSSSLLENVNVAVVAMVVAIGPGVDGGVRRGDVGIGRHDGPRVRCRREIGVALRVDSDDRERVGAETEAGVLAGRRARCRGGAIDRAQIGQARPRGGVVAAAEGEVGRRRRARIGRVRRDGRARRDRVRPWRPGHHRPGVGRRREIDVVERVDGAHLEGVLPRQQQAVRDRAGAFVPVLDVRRFRRFRRLARLRRIRGRRRRIGGRVEPALEPQGRRRRGVVGAGEREHLGSERAGAVGGRA